MTSEGEARTARAVLAGCAVAILALAAHTLASGSLPGLLPVCAVLAATALAVVPFSRRPQSILAMTGFLVAMQLISHASLWATSGHATHGHGSSLVPSAPMLGAHICAAAVAASLLIRLDAVASAWLALWQAMLGACAPPQVLATGRPLQASATPAPSPTVRLCAHAVIRRGPPAARLTPMFLG